CKQRSVTYSSTEAELNPLLDSFHEGIWLKALLVKKFGSNPKTQHIDLKTKGLRQEVKCNNVRVKLVKTDEMVANTLTKAASKPSILNLLHHIDPDFITPYFVCDSLVISLCHVFFYSPS
ncbi:hypothetical protein VP01_7330g2, partial [Puccinia sorghi]